MIVMPGWWKNEFDAESNCSLVVVISTRSCKSSLKPIYWQEYLQNVIINNQHKTRFPIIQATQSSSANQIDWGSTISSYCLIFSRSAGCWKYSQYFIKNLRCVSARLRIKIISSVSMVNTKGPLRLVLCPLHYAI